MKTPGDHQPRRPRRFAVSSAQPQPHRKPNRGRKTYDLVPADFSKVLQPGILSYVFELEDADPARTLMVELPSRQFFETRAELERFVVEKLGVSLVVILIPDEDAA